MFNIEGGKIDVSLSTYVALMVIWVIVLFTLIFDKWFSWVMVFLVPLFAIVRFMILRNPYVQAANVVGVI